ncbi:hypothetical protein N7494_005914 [Penicillium frequentans]|uniref:Protoporphyrinogen oxidase n=1 Tax=Penicillium frequentans TaxID=3151616 RepID=A0AAD6CXN1_9EURO|nr:hypothetical protein N7494_005914 [Penicillium glabrum]
MGLLTSNGLKARQRPLATACRFQYRAFHAAVIGGGITGLTSAFHLSRNSECSSVTVYEKSPRLGGWMRSERVPVRGGDVLFEYGPRTIRCSNSLLPTWLMAEQVGLANEAVWTPKNSPAAANRFIYYPDHLVRLPSPRPGVSFASNIKNAIQTFRNEPLFNTLIPAILFESFKPPRGIDQWQKDESIADFISRRFTPEVADNLVSAGMHGIYAGDIDKLSAQALLGPLRNMEATGIISSLFTNMFSRKQNVLCDDYIAGRESVVQYLRHNEVTSVRYMGQQSTTLTFKQGTQQLVDAIAADLAKSTKVTIETSSDVQSMSPPAGHDQICITSRQNGGDISRRNYDRVIASLPAPALTKILESTNTNHPGHSPHETIRKLKLHDYATTVMVVNLYYDNPVLPIEGFGYLIPRSVPFDQNPECGLGVLFASASSWGVPTSGDQFISQDNAPGTKLTVMLGGHYWDDWKDSDYPDHDSAVKMACALLERHIGIKATPSVTRSSLQKNAIPQYTVGHIDRNFELSKSVKKEFKKRLVLAGNWYTGVGVNDCVRQGILAASVGIGQQQIEHVLDMNLPYGGHNIFEWDMDMEGGIPTASSQYTQISRP